MKIEIKNLGPILSYEFDLTKDMNIVFGQNNIGKSYAITAIYLVLKNLISLRNNPIERDFYYYRHGEFDIEFEDEREYFQEIISAQEKLIQRIKRSKADEIDITKDIEEIFASVVNELVTQNLEKSFKNSFSSIENLTNKYSGEKFTIKLSFEDFNFTISARGNKLYVDNLALSGSFTLKRIVTNRRPHYTKEKTTIYFNSKTKTGRMIGFFDAVIGKFYQVLRKEITQIVNRIYFLPASRSGLYQALSTFSAVIAELSKSRTFLTKKIELPNISEPVSDYFLSLSNISNKRTSKAFREIIAEIENEILKGEIIFNRETNKIVFSPKGIKNELDLAFTSSMISEIAPIVAFLKYIIVDKTNINSPDRIRGPYNVVFIEEPEAHLHPIIQVKLMELFSKLINYNVKIVMTSHSNYMFNKLSNLILGQKVAHDKVGSYLMKMTEKGSVVDSLAMKPDSEGIIDENFSDIAEKLYEERISIYDKLNNNADSKNQG